MHNKCHTVVISIVIVVHIIVTIIDRLNGSYNFNQDKLTSLVFIYSIKNSFYSEVNY